MSRAPLFVACLFPLVSLGACGGGAISPDGGVADQGVAPTAPDLFVARADAAVDAGSRCATDTDCTDKAAPYCDAASGRCGACSTKDDRCASGTYCAPGSDGARCVPGCKGDVDCGGADGGASVACCEHACVDTSSSKSDCGACGRACATSCCDGACVDTASDAMNCGACGRACASANAVPMCVGGACMAGACRMGFGDCDGDPMNGCEVDLTSSADHCGACANACAVPNASPLCVSGACAVGACDAGWLDCDGKAANGCEVDVRIDPVNCGACGASCARLPHAAAACRMGGCAIGGCDAGFGNCDGVDANGCESPLASDPANCGACGNACPAPPHVVTTCNNAVCGVGGCAPGFLDCNQNPNDGCEAAPTSDPNNCGKCGVVCPAPANATAACSGGQCGIGSCLAGWADCDKNPANGCELNVSADNANCGGCGVQCGPNQNCVGGQCQGTFLVSDTSWRQTLNPGAGNWQDPNYDDNAWAPAVDEGGLGGGPWGFPQGFPRDSTAHWVWYYDSRNQGDNSTVYFRRAFVAPKGQMSLTITVDNTWVVYLNGQQVTSGIDWTVASSATLNLTPGAKYVLAIQTQNQGGPGGVLLDLR